MGIYVDNEYVCRVLGYDESDSVINDDLDTLVPIAEELVNTYCGGGIEIQTSAGTPRIFDGISNSMCIFGCYLKTLETVEFLDSTNAVVETPTDCVPQPTKNRLNLYTWIERRFGSVGAGENFQYTSTPTFPLGSANIRITGTWGFATIPEAVKLATAHAVKHIISLRSASTIATAESGFGRNVMYKNLDLKQILPGYVQAMLRPYTNRTFMGS